VEKILDILIEDEIICLDERSQILTKLPLENYMYLYISQFHKISFKWQLQESNKIVTFLKRTSRNLINNMTISSFFQSFQERLVRLFSDYCFDYCMYLVL
jgi:hypothetical protein